MGLHKILKIVALILSLAGIVLWLMILTGGEGVEGLIYVAYITLAIILAFVVFFVFKGIFQGDIKKTMLSVGAFLLVVVIAYVMAEGVEAEMPNGKILSAGNSKWVGAGLYAFYILAFVAVGAMAMGSIKKLMSK